MTRRYRAYDETIDKWRYFTIVATTQGWELTYLHSRVGDRYAASENDNFAIAHDNMIKIIGQLGLTKLTEMSGTDA